MPKVPQLNAPHVPYRNQKTRINLLGNKLHVSQWVRNQAKRSNVPEHLADKQALDKVARVINRATQAEPMTRRTASDDRQSQTASAETQSSPADTPSLL